MATKPTTPKTSKIKKRNFSSFNYEGAFRELNLKNLTPWTIVSAPVTPSAFFQERLDRLRDSFDLSNYEESKKLLIDAICEEAIQPFKQLKIWKGAPLSSDRLTGFVDYLISERKAYMDKPFLCVIEAKKDNFEQGLAQCLVEMKACQWQNSQTAGLPTADTFGIISNGTTWCFCKLTPAGSVHKTMECSIATMEVLLGQLHDVLNQCNQILIDRLSASKH
jgi:hypothetical protein